MSSTSLVLVIIGLAAISYFTGSNRARMYETGSQKLVSLPAHYGYLSAIWSVAPAIILLLIWMVLEPAYLESAAKAGLPASILQQSSQAVDLYLNNVYLVIANGGISGDPVVQGVANAYLEAQQKSRWLVSALVVFIGASGIIFGFSGLLMRMHARRCVEAVIRLLLLICSGVAIITTIGIVLSVLFESIRFFEAVPLFDFMFGTNWSPPP